MVSLFNNIEKYNEIICTNDRRLEPVTSRRSSSQYFNELLAVLKSVDLELAHLYDLIKECHKLIDRNTLLKLYLD